MGVICSKFLHHMAPVMGSHPRLSHGFAQWAAGAQRLFSKDKAAEASSSPKILLVELL